MRTVAAPSQDADQSKACLVIAEIAQAHDGSLGMAHAYIDAVAAAGADAVKFQTHIAAAESTPEEPWRVKFSQQDASRYAYWKRMEFTEKQWLGLKSHADERGLKFISSPFSLEAVELLLRVGVAAWKVASGELSNIPMLSRLTASGLPIILSSGLSSMDELDLAVQTVKAAACPLTVLQCTSIYPCPAEQVGLNMIPVFRERYDSDVGLSDHSGTIYAGLAAATMGISALEVHVTFSREMFGPDIPASVTMDEFRQLVEGIRFIERMNAHPVDKNSIARAMQPTREMFTKSLVVRRDLPAGAVIRREDLTEKKPGTGIPPSGLQSVIGRTLRHAIRADQLLKETDLL